MTTPDLTLTMLGTTSSGKTTFLLGMYDILCTGVQGYFTFTEDPDQGVDLQDAWDLLIDEGELPPPNAADNSKHYRFVFNHGVTPLVTIDWMDYRGGALDDRRDSGADVLELRARLERSDSIYLVLDGGSLATWLDDPSKRAVVQKRLKVQAMSSQVLRAVTNRKKNGLPLPSLAVLITKADLLRGPDRGVGEALGKVVEGLSDLLPVVWAQGVTTLVCPVKVGDFGTNSTGVVDVSTIDPVGLHRPMIFSLMHYLSEGLGERGRLVAAGTASQSEAEQQIGVLNQGFKAHFHARRVAQLREVADSYRQTVKAEQQQYESDQDLIAQLGRELAGHPIIRNGKLEL
jgi:hypothetical protein